VSDSITPLGDYQTEKRMRQKLKAIPLPLDLRGKTVLDAGCDHGAWCKIASDRGASRVLGLDRGRAVRVAGQDSKREHVDLVALNSSRGWPRCMFRQVNLGQEWPDVGPHDLVLCFSLHHHVYGETGSHGEIWHWLWFHTVTQPEGLLLWEGPLDTRDGVAAGLAAPHGNFTPEAILGAAQKYFDVEDVGPALHFPYRRVLSCRPHPGVDGVVVGGAGMASRAFTEGRLREIEDWWRRRPYPGTLNLVPATSSPEAVAVGFGEPDLCTEYETPIGPLRWWRVLVHLPGLETVSGLLVRGAKTRTKYLEIVAPERLRGWVGDGDRIRIERL